ncbi:MAG: hypothetical protein J3R72DRAFT_49062 [Linnemannia gamsii]|nr:MAG: hypothetical protein J3R72DRAFT_49062 [Linnemannia gamsii]
MSSQQDTRHHSPHQQHRRRMNFKDSKWLLVLIALGFSNSLAVLISNVSAFAGSHPTKIDTFMRQTLCSNHGVMCAASCQNNVQTEYCNSETLEWTCVCNQGTSSTINTWQYPIPYSLCRIQLLQCIKSCPRIVKDSSGDSPDQKIRIAVETPLSGDEDDMDMDDYNAIQELRVLRQNDRLEESSYSRFQVEGLREQLAIKKKQLHKHLWAAEQRQKQRQNRWSETEDGGRSGVGERFSYQNTVVSFTTLTDPTAIREADCVVQCHEVMTCGTETAPEYHGIQRIDSPRNHAS